MATKLSMNSVTKGRGITAVSASYCAWGILWCAYIPLVLQLFFQYKGDMVLKIVEKGAHKDVVIKEGEVGGAKSSHLCLQVL